MLIREICADRMYLACGYTDMRKQVDGRAALVESRFHLNPYEPLLFLFCGRRRDRIKARFRIRFTVFFETPQLSAMLCWLIPRLASLRISRYLVISMTSLGLNLHQ